MARKRAVSIANVGSKRAKMSRELGALVDKEDKIGFQNDLQWLQTELKKNPSKMRSVKSVVKLDVQSEADKDTNFAQLLLHRSIARIPPTFLVKKWLPALKELTREELQAIYKANPKNPHRIMYRLTHTTDKNIIHVREQEAWMAHYNARASIFGSSLKEIVFDRTFNINWGKSGHFGLLPKAPDSTDPDVLHEHIFTSITFRDVERPLGDDIKIRGTFTVEENWNHKTAWLKNPLRPDLKLLCYTYFVQDSLSLCPEFDKATPEGLDSEPLALEGENGPADPLAICDGASASSKAAKSEASGSTQAELTKLALASSSASSSAAPPALPATPTATPSPVKKVGLPGLKVGPPRTPPTKRQAVADLIADLSKVG